jgi:tRNA pseudouridine(55) synthase
MNLMNLDDVVFALIDKPEGLTSQECVSKIKKALHCSKVGHGGTLDPFATGALPIFFESWTRLASLFAFADKRYQATLSLGQKTDTGDKTGTVISKGPAAVANQANCRLLERSLIGNVDLPIPIYSALKIDGVPMHQLARSGKLTQPVKRRSTTIHELSLEAKTADTVLIDVKCSHGTYIRSLGEHIASKLKTQGHLSVLKRTAYYLNSAQQALPLVELETFLENPEPYVIKLHQLADILPVYHLNRQHYRDFLTGKMRRIPLRYHGWYLMHTEDRMIGVVFLEDGRITQRVNVQKINNTTEQEKLPHPILVQNNAQHLTS